MNRYQVKPNGSGYGVFDVVTCTWVENILNEYVMTKKAAEQLARDLNR